MFIKENYVLGNEIADNGKFNIANISMLKKKLEDTEGEDDIKMLGNCTFVNVNSPYLPNYIRENTINCTDFTAMLPLTYIKKEFGTSKETIMKYLKDYIVSTKTICKKDFIEFNSEFVNTMNKNTWYILYTLEMREAIKNNYIDGAIQISPIKYLCWY